MLSLLLAKLRKENGSYEIHGEKIGVTKDISRWEEVILVVFVSLPLFLFLISTKIIKSSDIINQIESDRNLDKYFCMLNFIFSIVPTAFSIL
jgi:hypothetical protein